MVASIEKAFHNQWLKNLKKLKGVKNVTHLRTTSKPPQFFIVVNLKGEENKTLRYKLSSAPSIEMQDDYEYILKDLKKKGHG